MHCANFLTIARKGPVFGSEIIILIFTTVTFANFAGSRFMFSKLGFIAAEV